MDICQMDDCGKPVKSRGLCSMHYQRALTRGAFVPYHATYLEDGEATCPKCAQKKSIEEFKLRKRSNGRVYIDGYCKLCWADLAKIARDSNKHAQQEFNARRRVDRQGNPRKYLAADLRKNFRMTVEQFYEMFERQGGVCAICGRANDTGRRLSVDHDRACCAGAKSCGKCVRDLLCDRCNPALGAFGDSLATLANAQSYLRKWGKS